MLNFCLIVIHFAIKKLISLGYFYKCNKSSLSLCHYNEWHENRWCVPIWKLFLFTFSMYCSCCNKVHTVGWRVHTIGKYYFLNFDPPAPISITASVQRQVLTNECAVICHCGVSHSVQWAVVCQWAVKCPGSLGFVCIDMTGCSRKSRYF